MGSLGKARSIATWIGSRGAARAASSFATSMHGIGRPVPKARSWGARVSRANKLNVPQAPKPIPNFGNLKMPNWSAGMGGVNPSRVVPGKKPIPNFGDLKLGNWSAGMGGVNPSRPAPPMISRNPKGKSGFSHGKKLRYGAVGVGAVGVAWGLMQRNHSTDKTGYSQSRGIRNY